MIDKKQCKGCLYLSWLGFCNYFTETEKTRTSLKALEVCSVRKTQNGPRNRRNDCVAVNVKREAVRKMFAEGRSDKEMAKALHYAEATIRRIRMELKLYRRPKKEAEVME